MLPRKDPFFILLTDGRAEVAAQNRMAPRRESMADQIVLCVLGCIQLASTTALVKIAVYVDENIQEFILW